MFKYTVLFFSFPQQNVLKRKNRDLPALLCAPPPPTPTFIQRKWSMDDVMHHVTKIRHRKNGSVCLHRCQLAFQCV